MTLGQAMKANIVAAGIPGEKIVIAPNAVGGAFLEQPGDAADARRELGLAGGRTLHRHRQQPGRV